MHAIKGGWVGQTFALAKCNDSGGRKSRIRRSKEERKAMVESFIKKYQKSNKGNFPSLNLTHKEVGGSFYTVREIVREIIQENRVLGPAKLTPEEQHTVQFSEQYPLGSISTEPQVNLFSSSTETDFVPNHHQVKSEEVVLDCGGKSTGPEHHIIDYGQIINGNQMDKQNEQSNILHAELEVDETLGAKNTVLDKVEVTAAKVTHITAEVVVETFPLRPVTKPSYSSDGELSEASVMIGTLKEKQKEKVETEPENNISLLDGKNWVEDPVSSVDEKAVTGAAGSLLEINSCLVGEEAVENLADPLLESYEYSSTNKDVHYGQDGTGLKVKTSHSDSLLSETFEESQEIAVNNVLVGIEVKTCHSDSLLSETFEQSPETLEIKHVDSSNGFHVENMNCSRTSSTFEKTISEEAILIEKKPDIHHGGSSQKGSNPTLDRINLESWEVQKSEEPETNPFLTFVKSFVAAFMKFWSG